MTTPSKASFSDAVVVFYHRLGRGTSAPAVHSEEWQTWDGDDSYWKRLQGDTSVLNEPYSIKFMLCRFDPTQQHGQWYEIVGYEGESEMC